MSLRGVPAALLLLGAALCSAAEQAAALTCEQLFAMTKSAVQYRDEGYSLAQVLGALKSVQSEGKLTAAEIETLRRAITLVYLGNAWPEEIALECESVKGSK